MRIHFKIKKKKQSAVLQISIKPGGKSYNHILTLVHWAPSPIYSYRAKLSVSLSPPSLSLYIYLYIYMCVCVCVFIYIIWNVLKNFPKKSSQKTAVSDFKH